MTDAAVAAVPPLRHRGVGHRHVVADVVGAEVAANAVDIHLAVGIEMHGGIVDDLLGTGGEGDGGDGE